MSALLDRLAAAVALAAPADLLPGDLAEPHDGPLRAAAVLIAVTDRPEPGLILTQRRADLREHGGQIAFPGGRIDAGERAADAALREAWEEIALDPAKVRLVGPLDPYRTVTGFGVTPLLGIIPPGLPLAPNPAEVADLFEAPLAYLTDPANQQRRHAEFRGVTRHYVEILFGEKRIWGATAAMLVNLSKRMALAA